MLPIIIGISALVLVVTLFLCCHRKKQVIKIEEPKQNSPPREIHHHGNTMLKPFPTFSVFVAKMAERDARYQTNEEIPVMSPGMESGGNGVPHKF